MPLKDRTTELREKQAQYQRGAGGPSSTSGALGVDPAHEQLLGVYVDPASRPTRADGANAAEDTELAVAVQILPAHSARFAEEQAMPHFFALESEARTLVERLRAVLARVLQHQRIILEHPALDDSDEPTPASASFSSSPSAPTNSALLLGRTRPLRDELEQWGKDFQRDSQRVRNILKEMNESIAADQKAPTERISQGNLRIKRNHWAALQRDFTDVLNEFTTAQAKYHDDWKDRVRYQLKIVMNRYSCTDEEIERIVEKGGADIYTEQQLQQTMEARQQLRDLDARHAEFLRLEQSLIELHRLFTEVAQLVESQGAVVDNIESNVNNAVAYVDTGRVMVDKAKEYQKSARKKKIIIIIIVVAVVVVLIIVVAVVLKMRFF